MLSVIAGSADVISFLALGGLFTAHITGNLVILAAHIVTGSSARLDLLALAIGLAAGLDAAVERR